MVGNNNENSDEVSERKLQSRKRARRLFQVLPNSPPKGNDQRGLKGRNAGRRDIKRKREGGGALEIEVEEEEAFFSRALRAIRQI